MTASVMAQAGLAVTLPEPRRDSGYSLERALADRRTVREFADVALRLADVAQLAWGQRWIAQAPAILVIAAVERRTTGKYGERGVRYAHMEAGHAARNALRQARALGLDAGLVGAFTDADVQAALGLPREARPLYLIPVGRSP